MAIKTATPYLIVNGQAREAIPFYEKAFGAKVHSKQTFGEGNPGCPDASKELIMHAELRLESAVIMLSDGPGPGPKPSGTGVSVALSLDDRAQARKIFEALSQEGEVHTPLFDSPWGSLFGVVRDRFGIGWMFDAT